MSSQLDAPNLNTSEFRINIDNTEDILQAIITASIKYRASDIHLESSRDTFNVRIRIDGMLHLIDKYPKIIQDKTLSQIKVLAQINIVEHRVPQDGHFEYKIGNVIYNIRVSSIPGIFGENMVLRLLDRDNMPVKLEELGLEPDQLQVVQQLITSPSGMVLTTGPTGAGKTTILYSLLNLLNQPEKNIITLEDPIEYVLQNIRQTQIDEASGLTFDRAMRSVVRQDPNVIMVGEIRDPETAQMAMQASLIGILVLSTFHTFDIPTLISRFKEMGVTASILGQSVVGFISTRLLRRICQSCKQSYQLNDLEKAMLGNRAPATLVKGYGCENCNHTGFHGRTGIFEVVYFDQDIKSSIIESRPASFIYQLLAQKRVKSLKDVAINKVLNGETTTSELLRVLGILAFKKEELVQTVS